jgi:type I restriction enzyme S subunit
MRDGWTETTLGDVVELGKGGAWGADEMEPNRVEAVCLRGTDLADLIDKKHPEAPVRWLTPTELKKAVCAPNTVLIETSGSKCGRSVVLTVEMLSRFELPVVYSNFCRTLRIDTRLLSSRYVEMWFSHKYEAGVIPSYRATSAMPNLDVKSLLRMETIAVPPLGEQKRIVDVVSSVDAYIDALQQQVDTARTARDAVLHELLSAGGDDWTETTLGKTLEIARGGSPRPIKDYITSNDDGVNWVKIGDASASSKYIYKTEQKIRPEGVSRSRPVKAGDFILSNSMSFGRPYIMRTDGCIHDGWLLFSKVEKHFDEDFLYNLLMSDLVQKQFDSLAAGSGVRNLNIEVAKEVVIPFPPLKVQQEIAEVANGLDEFILAVEQTLVDARNLRSGMLSDLLSGEHEIPRSYDKFLGAA